MSKSNTNVLLVEMVDSAINGSRKTILNTIIRKYKVKKKDAEKIEKLINRSTMTTLNGTYSHLATPEIDCQILHYPLINDVEYPELEYFRWIAENIPVYQSLGDTIGYNNGKWEFNYGEVNLNAEYVNELIYEFIYLGGINELSIKDWRASDDTILYLATMQVLIDKFGSPISQIAQGFKEAYIEAMPLMENRHPGRTTMTSLEVQKTIPWNKLRYDSRSIGAGAAMRTGCIGIFYPGITNRQTLVEIAVECSRITHNSAIAILGGVVSALFTAYSLERVAVNEWPNNLLKFLRSDIVDSYIKRSRPDDFDDFVRDKILYVKQWESYTNLLLPGINPNLDQKLMKNPVQRYKYLAANFSKGCDIPGSCGDDAVIMAYDSLLRSRGNTEKLLVYSILHPGDSDTVGSIAFSWFCGYYLDPKKSLVMDDRMRELEFGQKIRNVFKKSNPFMAGIYYQDMYLNIAIPQLKKYMKNIGKIVN